MSFGCGRLLFFVLVLFWNNFFPLCTFIPSRSLSASIGAEETLYISEGNMAFLHSCYNTSIYILPFFYIFIFVLVLTSPTTIGFTKKNHFFRTCFESKSFFRGKIPRLLLLMTNCMYWLCSWRKTAAPSTTTTSGGHQPLHRLYNN